MDSTPARRSESERRLTQAEVEAVIGRAIELHVQGTASPAREEIPESELLRIGGELGLPPQHVRQALAEVDGGIGGDRSWLGRNLGEGRAGASRIIERSAAAVQRDLERYLLETECMVVERRFPGRTVYSPASGLVASAARAMRQLGGRHALLQADHLEVGVQPLDEHSCCVAITVDLTRKRRDLALSGVAGGGLSGVAAVAAGTALVPPAALVGLPLAAAAFFATRSAYRNALAEASRRIESLLDRLVHGELRRGPALRTILGL